MMSEEYKYRAQFTYTGILDHVFDGGKLERISLSTCPCGPMTFRGRLNRKEVRIEACSDETYWVLGKSQREVNNLAKRIEKISLRLTAK